MTPLNGRERVLTTFGHEEPDRVPRWCGASPEFLAKARLTKMYDQPEIVDAVLQHVVDYYAAVSERIFDAAAEALDIFFIGNDFGSQNGPLLSPAQFERFMVPHLRRLVDLGHAYRLKVQLHCCGGFEPLIPALISMRLDGLHAIQARRKR